MFRSLRVRPSTIFAIVAALLLSPVTGFVPTKGRSVVPLAPPVTSRSCSGLPHTPVATTLWAEQSSSRSNALVSQGRRKNNENKVRRWELRKIVQNRHHYFIIAAALLVGVTALPSPCFASNMLSHLPSPNDLKATLVSGLDRLSSSGIKGMVIYTLSFIVFTMTFGMTTPVETAAGMAFPLEKAIPLSFIGKACGAFFQYVLAKYLFSDFARKKLKDNEWMDKISGSFKSHPYRVALIWRFSPLPEFMKNIGPALVPTLRTKYQILAIVTHGLPFSILWSCVGGEAARVARGGQASVLFKQMVALISWVGIFVSPTLFGRWLKGLGEPAEESDTIS